MKRIVDDKEISILSPEDCVRDRLSSYVYFKAAECLDQAVLVAKEQNIDIRKIDEWAQNEGKKMVEAIKQLEEKMWTNKR